MKWKDRPCNLCRRPGGCSGVECGRWQGWFLDAWEDVNRKAEAEIQKQNRFAQDKFFYGLPHEAVDPCLQCPLGGRCEVPCQKRLWWWDLRMERIGRRFGK